jgi:AAA15 family ATPase/GTPase
LSNENQPRLLSFALDGWDVLGGRVSVSLSDRVAVLVGRNGAGKSAILEGFEAISSCALGRKSIKFSQIRQNNASSIPKILEIEVLTPNNRRLMYHYELLVPITNDSESSENKDFSWNDCCKYIDGKQELVWSTEAGLTTFVGETDPVIVGSTSSFRPIFLPMKNAPAPVEMKCISQVLQGIHLIGNIPADQVFERQSSLLRTYDGITDEGNCLADGLSFKLLNLERQGKLSEIESIFQRIELANKISVKKFVLSGHHLEEPQEYVSSVFLDDVNIGLLSNGTLRIISILIGIVASRSSTTNIIEEPEIQIHPGMLAKLLNEIDAYTFGDENLIISTHSPQVVSWTKPDRINLVYRNNSQTFVRKLGEDEIHRVVEYLNEEGDLGEWLYSGILDE